MSTGIRRFAPLAVAAALAIGCTTLGTQISDEEFAAVYSGAWSNPEYGPLTYSAPDGIQRIVTHGDGTVESYKRIDDALPEFTRKPDFVARWRDAEGNTWYRSSYMFAADFAHYELAQISRDGQILERLIALKPLDRWSEGKELKEYAPTDGTHYWHLIYYRD